MEAMGHGHVMEAKAEQEIAGGPRPISDHLC